MLRGKVILMSDDTVVSLFLHRTVYFQIWSFQKLILSLMFREAPLTFLSEVELKKLEAQKRRYPGEKCSGIRSLTPVSM